MSATQAAIDALFEPSAEEPVATCEAPSPAPIAPPRARKADVKRILHLSVPVSVTLAETDMSVESILALNVGSILEFEMSFDAELSLRVSGREIGSGQAVKVGENFGLRVTRIGPVEDRIDAMGGT